MLQRDRTKRPIMGRLATQIADYSIVTSDNPRNEVPEAILAEIVVGFATHPAELNDMARAAHQAGEAHRSGRLVALIEQIGS